VTMTCGTKKRRRRTRREIIAERAFENSLYMDYSLFVQPTKVKSLGVRVPSVPLPLKSICRNSLAPFDVVPTIFRSKESLHLQQHEHYDFIELINKTILVRTLLELAIKRERTELEDNVENWFNKVMDRREQLLSIEWQERKAIEWKPKLAITWMNNEEVSEKSEDDVQIIAVKHYIPEWLSKIDVFDHYHKVPRFMKNIDATIFTDTIENESSIPEWMQKLDVIQMGTKKSKHEISAWMKKIDIYDYSVKDCYEVPSWLRRINLCEENFDMPYPDFYNWIHRSELFRDYSLHEVLERCQWDELMHNPMEQVIHEPRDWLQCVHMNDWYNPKPLVRSVQKVCESMMSVAVFVAACDICTSAKNRRCSVSSTVSENSSVTRVSQKQKASSTMSTVDVERKKRTSIKKNKAWLKRLNASPKVSQRKSKYLPTRFSRKGGIRAC